LAEIAIFRGGKEEFVGLQPDTEARFADPDIRQLHDLRGSTDYFPAVSRNPADFSLSFK